MQKIPFEQSANSENKAFGTFGETQQSNGGYLENGSKTNECRSQNSQNGVEWAPSTSNFDPNHLLSSKQLKDESNIRLPNGWKGDKWVSDSEVQTESEYDTYDIQTSFNRSRHMFLI